MANHLRLTLLEHVSSDCSPIFGSIFIIPMFGEVELAHGQSLTWSFRQNCMTDWNQWSFRAPPKWSHLGYTPHPYACQSSLLWCWPVITEVFVFRSTPINPHSNFRWSDMLIAPNSAKRLRIWGQWVNWLVPWIRDVHVNERFVSSLEHQLKYVILYGQRLSLQTSK